VFTRPEDLTDDEVRVALELGWALDVTAVEHAPVGFGSHHWWVSTADGSRWFATADDLRARRHGTDEPDAAALGRLRAALTTAAVLREHGLDWVVAPRRTREGEVVVGLGGAYALAVYPAVEGSSFGWGPFESAAHRDAVLDRLVALHGVDGCRDAAAVDDLGSALVAGLRALLADPGERWDSGPFGADAWRLVVERGAGLASLVDRYGDLVADVDPAGWVLTHGEPHRANTVQTSAGVVLVDWDTCLVAPPERDVWMLAAEDAGMLEAYAARTGTALDPRLLAAYRLRWDLADVESCVRVLRAPHADDEDTRTAWHAVRAVLAPDSGP
jgi:spectinomycin phosphotransferase/16S rRNA (guanine(1405)-N(7))-methyltransferase